MSSRPDIVDVQHVEYVRKIILDPENYLKIYADKILDIDSQQLRSVVLHGCLPVSFGDEPRGMGAIYRFRNNGNDYQFVSKNGQVTLSAVSD